MFILVWTHGYSFYTLDYYPLLPWSFCCSHCSSFGHCKLFQLASIPLWHASSLWGVLFFQHFLIYWHYKMLQIHLHIHTRTSHFFKEPWLLLPEHGIRSHDLRSRCAHCYWSQVPSGLLSSLGKGNICVYTNPYIHMYINMHKYNISIHNHSYLY